MGGFCYLSPIVTVHNTLPQQTFLEAWHLLFKAHTTTAIHTALPQEATYIP